jgi:hypothetical protein
VIVASDQIAMVLIALIGFLVNAAVTGARLERLRSDIKRLENSFRSDPEMHTSLVKQEGA